MALSFGSRLIPPFPTAVLHSPHRIPFPAQSPVDPCPCPTPGHLSANHGAAAVSFLAQSELRRGGSRPVRLRNRPPGHFVSLTNFPLGVYPATLPSGKPFSAGDDIKNAVRPHSRPAPCPDIFGVTGAFGHAVQNREDRSGPR